MTEKNNITRSAKASPTSNIQSELEELVSKLESL
jgi:hypothetical protein